MGGYSDGNTLWQHSMGVNDGDSQEVKSLPEGQFIFTLYTYTNMHLDLVPKIQSKLFSYRFHTYT